MSGTRVQQFGFTFTQTLFNQLPVIKHLAELDDFFPHKDVMRRNAAFQDQSFQRRATTQSDIRLAAGKHAACQIHHDTAERQPLALMHGDRPGKADRQLLECTDYFLFDLFFFFVVLIFIVAPGSRLDQIFPPVLQQDIDISILVDPRYHADRTIDPTPFIIIIDKDDLCLFLDGQVQLCRQRRFGEIAFDLASGDKLFTGQFP